MPQECGIQYSCSQPSQDSCILGALALRHSWNALSAFRWQGKFVTVLFEQGGGVLGHNIGEAHHTTLFQPTLIWFIRLLMYASADSLRCSVRWV